MRKSLIAALFACLVSCGFAEALDHWEFDSSAKTISDGVWTFSATLSGSTNLTIGNIIEGGYPAEISPLDFSKKVVKKDAVGTEYTITTINALFYNSKLASKYMPGAEYIGEFTLPTNGLITMANDGPYSQNASTNMFGDIIVPSSVTSMGRCWFQNSKITSITFDGCSATVNGSYSGAGPCAKCSMLTSVVFTASANCTLSAGFVFQNCSGLSVVDLSGVTNVATTSETDASRAHFSNCASLKKLIVGPNLARFPNNVIFGNNNNKSLDTICFLGTPPAEFGIPYLSGIDKNQPVTAIVPAEFRNTTNSAGVCWTDYSASGRLNTTDSTFASDYVKSDVTDLSKRKLLLDREPEDDPPTIGEISCDVWPYKATITVNGYGLNGGAILVSVTNSAGTVTGPAELDAFGKDCTLNGLAASTQYSVIVVATNSYGAVTNAANSFTTLEAPMHLTATKTCDVDQATGTAGAFVISRSDDDPTSKSVDVSYSVDGTAVSNTDYVALSGSATIPAGAKSATIVVSPIYNQELDEPRTLTITIQTSKAYEIVVGSAEMSVSKSKAFDGWTYNGTSISKGGWTFTVKSVSGVNMTVGSCTVWPDDVAPLDLGGIIISTAGTYYKIVRLDTRFGYYKEGSPYRVEPYLPQAYRVGALTIPEGVEIIDQYAFGSCTNLTLAVALPSSLTYIDHYAFSSTKLSGDIVLTNLNVLGVAALAGTKITSLKFGPNLTTLDSSYDRGFVQDCTSLTNIVFDPASSTGQIKQFTFKGCTALTELDLSTFTSFQDPTKSDNAAFLNCTSLRRVTFSDKMDCIYPYSLFTSYDSKCQLDEVVFTGVPPVAVFTNYLSGVSSSKTVKTLVHKNKLSETNAAGKCWLDYAANREISDKNTTWKGDYLVSGVSESKRLLLTIEKPGFMIIVR